MSAYRPPYPVPGVIWASLTSSDGKGSEAQITPGTG